MSQTGELEPTECTHVCSVESGCILDTENLENNDADVWEVGTPSNADQKDTEDGGLFLSAHHPMRKTLQSIQVER